MVGNSIKGCSKMDFFSRVIIFCIFIIVGSLAIGLPDFIFGVIFAITIVFIRPDIFKSKKHRA